MILLLDLHYSHQKGFKTMYRHFDKLGTAKLFASNVNIKNNCKIYVDLDFHKDEMKNYSIKLYGKQMCKENENHIPRID